jgi:Macrocin-O-methyltransferase (TylF)
VEFSNNEKQQINTPQAVYDAFNTFVFSNDTKVLAKLLARAYFVEKTRDVPGDIVELGVFKGSGLLSWLKAKRVLSPGYMKKVIGFDYFDTERLLESLSGLDRQRMAELFGERGFAHKDGAEQWVADACVSAGFSPGEYELVRGDVISTTRDFCARRPGFKASILYMDLDVAEPTYEALRALWPRLSPGGVVVFDEYAYHQWSEAAGADRFFAEVGARVKALPFNAPTAYVEKP